MPRKYFFVERTAKEILQLNVSKVFPQKNLVQKILDINPSSEAIEIRSGLLPSAFYIGTNSWKDASNKSLKHGDYISLSQPRTITDAFQEKRLPHEIRRADFEQLRDIPESELDLIGYSFRPIQGGDKRKRLVPFSWILEGTRIFSYSEALPKGIEVKPYDDAAKVAEEGTEVIVKVPSREKSKRRYTIRFKHVPIKDEQTKRVICWNLSTNYEETGEPAHQTYHIRYRFRSDREGSDVKVFYPHEIAGYLAIAKHYWREENRVPWDMNPFAKPSQELVDFYKLLSNNLLIYDPTLSGRNKTRKLHIAEKCILLGRAVRTLGHDRTLLWDPKRDPKTLAGYNWSIS